MTGYSRSRCRKRAALIPVDTYDRTNILLPSAEQVIDRRDGEDSRKHDDRPVHTRRIHRGRDWEETRRGCCNDVSQCESVDGNAEAAKREAGVWQRRSADATLQNASDGERVREGRGACQQGDDGIEGRGAPEVDEREDDHDREREENGVDGDRGADCHDLWVIVS